MRRPLNSAVIRRDKQLDRTRMLSAWIAAVGADPASSIRAVVAAVGIDLAARRLIRWIMTIQHVLWYATRAIAVLVTSLLRDRLRLEPVRP